MKLKKFKFKDFLKNLLNRVLAHDLSTMSAAMSYYYLSASLPLLLVLTNLVGKYLGGNRDLLLEFVEILPGQTQDIIIYIIDSFFKSKNSSSLSVITLIFAVWSASKGIFKLLDSLNVAYGFGKFKSSIYEKILSFLYTLVLILIVIIFMTIRIYGPKLIDTINNFLNDFGLSPLTDQVTLISRLISGFLPLIVMSIALALLYKLAANRDKNFNITFKQGLVGGIFTTLVIYIGSFIYSFFLDNISKMSVIYGTLAGVLSLFIWIMIFSYSIILGAEVIAAFMEQRKGLIRDIPEEIEENIPDGIKDRI
ncbi:MAG: YihY/virulence factor BrkB family protein [Peptoniphilaceae bacterium]|nr:YihY/virulence factor BrkB family protein [Peptoniphilaceae bacterium]MDY6018178.1 YihY/virulence factor BrkB family protein [Anaerococcus sp.]